MGKGLSSDEIIRRVRHVTEPIAESLGLALWGVECVAGGRPVVRVYVDARGDVKNQEERIGSSFSPNGKDISSENDMNDFLEFFEGVSVEQCARLSRLLSPAVDAEEIFADPWVLEVSSPGLDRLFFEPSQMFPYVGEEVDVVLTDPHPKIPGRRKFKGSLLGVEENVLTMEVLIPPSRGEKPVPVPVNLCWEWVKKARLVPAFSPKSKPKPGKSGKAETNR